MTSPGLLFLASVAAFIGYALFVHYEARRGRRLFLNGLRGWLDQALDRVTWLVGSKLHYLGRHIIKLSWYYSIHSALRATLNLLVGAYDRLEAAFMANRERAKVIRSERRALKQVKSHLTVVAEHKASVELTPGEKKKLKDKSLAGR